MKFLTIRELREDKKGFEEMIAEQSQLLQDVQNAILRLEGALTYVTRNLERLEEVEKKPEEVKEKDA